LAFYITILASVIIVLIASALGFALPLTIGVANPRGSKARIVSARICQVKTRLCVNFDSL
jgi:hypothetical protein